ncbi:hypothetical protein L218DRAFT_431429 [Marasmius fiardii PR-910]|nr:hypothetical protein L218DRAFT_431429 [Marasmius fiardii PR-910]
MKVGPRGLRAHLFLNVPGSSDWGVRFIPQPKVMMKTRVTHHHSLAPLVHLSEQSKKVKSASRRTRFSLGTYISVFAIALPFPCVLCTPSGFLYWPPFLFTDSQRRWGCVGPSSGFRKATSPFHFICFHTRREGRKMCVSHCGLRSWKMNVICIGRKATAGEVTAIDLHALIKPCHCQNMYFIAPCSSEM